MIECEYLDLSGNKKSYDLDSVVEVIRGKSHKRQGWKALVIFNPSSENFIELRDSPPDPRGYSKDEAEEVNEDYLVNNFDLDEKAITSIKHNPKTWVFIDL